MITFIKYKYDLLSEWDLVKTKVGDKVLNNMEFI